MVWHVVMICHWRFVSIAIVCVLKLEQKNSPFPGEAEALTPEGKQRFVT